MLPELKIIEQLFNVQVEADAEINEDSEIEAVYDPLFVLNTYVYEAGVTAV